MYREKSVIISLLLLSILYEGLLASSNDKLDCTPDICELADIRCKPVTCGPYQTVSARGGEPCGCCPSCVDGASDGKEECGPHYCDNKRFNCPLERECESGYVSAIRPEICRCCPQCYKALEYHDKCGADVLDGVCGRHLICSDGRCSFILP